MRTPDIEGIANHGGPESCVGIRKDCRRSVDRGTYRPAIEPRNNSFGVPTPSHEAEGHIMSSAIASCFWTLRGLRPCACTESSCARTGRSHARPSVDHRAGRSGKAEAVSLR